MSRPFSSSPGMAAAFAEAQAASARGEVPIGAAITLNGTVVAAAGNRTRELHDPSAHAEVLAIRAACAATGSQRLPRHDLHVTLEPCAMCAALIGFARIDRLYYGASDPKGGGVHHGARVFTHATCHHAPEVYGGIGEAASTALLRDFFSARR